MRLDPSTIQHLRDTLGAGFPGFEGFDDPRFRSVETDYKREASAKAQSWFSRSALEAVIVDEPEALKQRIKDLAHETNLLFLGVPKAGDLALVHSDELDLEELGRRLLELLHGSGDSPSRLQSFADWVEAEGLPNKWTFPTYLLFLVHPETELFVKPTVMSGLLELVESDVSLGTSPTGAVYAHLLEISSEIRSALDTYDPKDMIDVQSVIFLAHAWGRDLRLSPEKHEELVELLQEFVTDYVQTQEGADHLAKYRQTREAAISNFRTIQEARKQGQELTNLVLAKLLPHADSEANRDRGAWVAVAPAIRGDVRPWFENKGWAQAGDWPRVAQRLWEFVERVVEHPEALDEQVKSLEKSGHGTGFQSGMLSPVLNALKPEHFIVLNVKSRRVINCFLDLKYDHILADYPALNRAGRYLAMQVEDELAAGLPEGTLLSDGLDSFCHWLVAVRKYPFGKSRAWRVQIEDPALWDEWVSEGVMGYAEHGLGDASGRTAQDWKTPPPGVDPKVVDAIRHLAAKLSDGDHIVAFDQQLILHGIGIVSGAYEFREGEALAHVLSVEWNDTTLRRGTGRAQKKVIKPMSGAELESAAQLPAIDDGEAEDAVFTRRTFDLLAGLTEDPTKNYYETHRKEFAEHLEEPFKRLLLSVASELPTPMIDELETEKGLFSKILKNDFGRGGAWDHYWGALYPKGQKRIAGAQLLLWVNRNGLQWGFYVGEYADEATQSILAQFRRRREALRAILREHLEEERFIFGAKHGAGGKLKEESGTRSVDEWIETIGPGVLSARTSLTREEVLATSEAELRDRIAADFRQLFPLILLSSHDDPIAAIEALAGAEEPRELQPTYALEQCAGDTGFDRATVSTWYEAIERKGQAVLYGPPGTGKTYMAEKLAKVLVSGGDGFIDLVQFHPAYAYEDFMQGIRPEAGSNGSLEFRMVPGSFLEFCREAQARQDTCVLIIDEINRANLSRVFGELMYLLEYRDQMVPLAGGGKFKIPVNVRIIGTMNTADRSIALVDHALRRRFAFMALRPRDEVLRRFHEDTGQSIDALIEMLAELNQQIGEENYHVGITFFMDPDLDKNLEAIWRMEIEPYLEEYFFDDGAAVARFRWDRISAELMGSE
jgi:5-methylcytosine-specific restriction protein B